MHIGRVRQCRTPLTGNARLALTASLGVDLAGGTADSEHGKELWGIPTFAPSGPDKPSKRLVRSPQKPRLPFLRPVSSWGSQLE
eukprot:6960027-Pyramimonas_sp.AAC.1